MRLPIPKPALEFINQTTEGIRGRILPRIQMSRLERVLTALALWGLAAFRLPPHTAVRHSMDVLSRQLLSIRTIRTRCTSVPSAQCAG